MPDITELDTWHQLHIHHETLKQERIEALRSDVYKTTINSVLVDYSHHHLTQPTFDLLFEFAHKTQLAFYLNSMFSKNFLNFTENRSVYHQALRFPEKRRGEVFGEALQQEMQMGLTKIQTMSEQIRKNHHIKHILHVGTGGSELGTKMVIQALEEIKDQPISIDFISNIDPYERAKRLKALNPNHTLVIVASKTFTTYETMENFKLLLDWLGGASKIHDHCIAITANQSLAKEYGFSDQNTLQLHEGIGGRYSVWSTMGLTIAIAFGFDVFQQFLLGGYVVDQHVHQTPLEENLAVRLALIDLWNINFYGAQTRAVIPYSERLSGFIAYLQQLVMESNGKSVNREGRKIKYQTGPIIWGGIGSSSQHTFHQLLMQGTQKVVVDFIAIRQANHSHHQAHLDKLNQQMYAQSAALCQGNLGRSVCHHRMISGDIPHNLFELEQLTPSALGTLLALYEYRTILTAFLWQINPFDQFGVELGKELALTGTLPHVT